MKRENYYDGYECHDSATGQQEAGPAKSGTSVHTLYGTCYWILFWILIPFLISNAMQLEVFEESFLGINIAGQILNIACIALYGCILMILSDLHPCYSKSGGFFIVISVFQVIAAVINNINGLDIFSLISSLLAFVSFMFFLRASYFEFQAHALIMEDIDDKLSRKWLNFRIWFMILIFAVPLSGAIIVAVLTVILTFSFFIIIEYIICIVSLLTLFILKCRYLYLTAYAYNQLEQ